MNVTSNTPTLQDTATNVPAAVAALPIYDKATPTVDHMQLMRAKVFQSTSKGSNKESIEILANMMDHFKRKQCHKAD